MVDIGKILASGAMGATSGFIAHQQRTNERNRIQEEEERKNRLLEEKARKLAKSKFEIETMRQDREDERKISDQKFQMKKLAKQHEYDIENSSLENSKPLFSKKEKIKLRMSARKDFDKFLQDDFSENKPDFDTWMKKYRPETYNILNDNTTDQRPGGVKGFDFEGIRKRVKLGPNQSSETSQSRQPLAMLPSHNSNNSAQNDKTNSDGDILEPQPLYSTPDEDNKAKLIKATVKKIKHPDETVRSIQKEIGYTKDRDLVIKLFEKLKNRLQELRRGN
jgi:hypothetical protein